MQIFRLLAFDLDFSAVDWAVILTAAGTLVSAAILGITAIYVYRSARSALDGLADARKTRHAQLVTDLSRRWDEPLVAESRKLFGKHTRTQLVEVVDRIYRPLPRPWYRVVADAVVSGAVDGDVDQQLADFYCLSAWPNLIETIGVLEAEGAISASVIHQMWGGGIIQAWTGWCDAIKALRAHEHRLTTYRHFERLAGLMAELERSS